MCRTNKQAPRVSWLGISVSKSIDGGDSTRTLSRTTGRDPPARNENDCGEGILEVHGVCRTLVVLRILRIYAIATEHRNEDWNQKSMHRRKLQTEQVNAEQR